MVALLRGIHPGTARIVMYWYPTRKLESLSNWLEIATKDLAQAGKQRITQEIEAHFADAVEARLSQGKPEPVAKANALAELGDPTAAGKRFRKKHFTEKEAKLLGAIGKTKSRPRELLLCYLISALLYLVYVVWLPAFAHRPKIDLYLFVFIIFLSFIIL